MAVIKIELNNQYKKPTIECNTALGGVSTLIDTGANIPIYFGSEKAFNLDFPTASLSNYITFVSGLGGTNKTPCPIYEIPNFVFTDTFDGQNSFTVHNMYIAIYDAPVNFGFSMLLGATVFSKVNYSFMNRLEKPYMKIDYKDDVYGTIEACLDESGHIYAINGKIVVDYMKTFFQRSNSNSIGVMSNKTQEKKYKKRV